jgi:hypothetical protein
MEKLKLRAESATKALKTLKEIVEEPYSTIVRDAAIKRFEYSFIFSGNLLKIIFEFKKVLSVLHQNLASEKHSK